ncbi:hypothetical protein ACVW17_003428 [Bradyrhizobium sp. USDA 4473]
MLGRVGPARHEKRSPQTELLIVMARSIVGPFHRQDFVRTNITNPMTLEPRQHSKPEVSPAGWKLTRHRKHV